jgi:hypothetical protein
MSERNRLKVGRIRTDRGGESAFDVPHRPLDDDRRPAGQGDTGSRDAATVLKAPRGLGRMRDLGGRAEEVRTDPDFRACRDHRVSQSVLQQVPSSFRVSGCYRRSI